MAMFLICILIFFSGHKGRSNNLLKEQAIVLLIINYHWAQKKIKMTVSENPKTAIVKVNF
jgi:hypothetical protein